MRTATTMKIQELRRRTGAGVLQCKTTLEATQGNIDQAVVRLRAHGAVPVEQHALRRTSEGVIASYIHFNGRLGAMVEVNCETDFVARTDEFTILARQLAEHIAAAAPLAVERRQLSSDLVDHKRRAFEEAVRAGGKPERLVATIVEGKLAAYYRDVVLMEQAWIRDSTRSIADLVNGVAARTGEQVRVRRFARFHMGLA